jgi:hypothetical protein
VIPILSLIRWHEIRTKESAADARTVSNQIFAVKRSLTSKK